MTRYALLLGSAKDGFRQKKVSQFHDSLILERGFSEREIAVFPNGISEFLLEFALNNAIEQNIENILLYICTSSPVLDSDEFVSLCDESIRKCVIEHYSSLFDDFQVIYDSDQEEISEDELGYVKCQRSFV